MWVSLEIINKLSLTLLALALPPTWEPGPGQAAAAKLVGEPSRGLELTSTVAWHLAWQPHNRDTLQGLSQVRTASGSAQAEIQADWCQSSLCILTNMHYNLGLLCVKSRENWIEFSLFYQIQDIEGHFIWSWDCDVARQLFNEAGISFSVNFTGCD